MTDQILLKPEVLTEGPATEETTAIRLQDQEPTAGDGQTCCVCNEKSEHICSNEKCKKPICDQQAKRVAIVRNIATYYCPLCKLKQSRQQL